MTAIKLLRKKKAQKLLQRGGVGEGKKKKKKIHKNLQNKSKTKNNKCFS